MFDLSVMSVSLFFLLFVSLILISVFVSRAKEVEAEGFFFADRKMHWALLGTSFIMSFLVGGYVYSVVAPGLGPVWTVVFGLTSILMIVLLGWILAPLCSRMKINTLPEYFERRFSHSTRIFFSTLYIFCNILIRLTAVLVAGNILINRISGVDPLSTLLLFLFVTGVYVLIGGLRTEVYAGLVQVILVVAAISGLVAWASGHDSLIHSIAYTAAANTPGSQNTVAFMPAGMAIAMPVSLFWFWCADQSILQKVVSVRSVYSTRRAVLLSSSIQLIPIALIFFAGSAFHTAVFTDRAIGLLFTDGAMPELVRVGMVIAVAAALMAQFAAIFNSTSLLFTFDIFKSIKPDASERTLLLVGRMTTVLLLLYSILLIPISQNLDIAVCVKLFRAFIYFGALIAGVLVVSLLNGKVRALSAMLTLHTVALVVLVRSALEIFLPVRSFDLWALDLFAKSDVGSFTSFVFLLTVVLVFIFQMFIVAGKNLTSLVKSGSSFARKIGEKTG